MFYIGLVLLCRFAVDVVLLLMIVLFVVVCFVIFVFSYLLEGCVVCLTDFLNGFVLLRFILMLAF